MLLLSYLSVGGRMALMRGFDPVVCMEAIVRDRLTVFVGLSLMYQAILDHPAPPGIRPVGPAVLHLHHGADGPPAAGARDGRSLPEFRSLQRPDRDVSGAPRCRAPRSSSKRFGNYWGESLIVNETAIMDDAGNLLPRGQAGELVHRGPNVMMGYYKDPKATEEARKFGWHHTGDLALIDENGEVLFLDRKKDMIKSGGENVASVKIEETLLAHPAVQNAAVVGLPHPQWGEAVSAFVKLKPGATADEAGIVEHCRRTPRRLSGAEAGQDPGRDADDRDRQAAQGRTAPGVWRPLRERAGVRRRAIIIVIPGREANPESITTIGSMDSGPAPSAHPGMTSRKSS